MENGTTNNKNAPNYSHAPVMNSMVDSSRLPDLPSPMVPMTIGGALVVFGMAAYRWLNGGDFVLFPPPNHDSSVQRDGEVDDDVFTNYENHLQDDKNHQDYDMKRDLEEASLKRKHVLNDENGLKPPPHTPQSALNYDVNGFSEESVLSRELQSLTKAIEKYTLVQEERVKANMNVKAKGRTDSAMEQLKRQNISSENGTTSNDRHHAEIQQQHSLSVQMDILVQITEIKCILEATSEKIQTMVSLKDDEQSVQIQKVLDTLSNIHENVTCIKTQFLCQEIHRADVYHEKKLESHLALNTVPIDAVLKDSVVEQLDSTAITTDMIPPLDASLEHQNQNENMGVSRDNHHPQVGIEAFENAIKKLMENNPLHLVPSTLQMLLLYITNLAENPTSEKYQKIYTRSNKFKSTVSNVPYAMDALHALGFVDDRSFLKWDISHSSSTVCDETSMIHLLKEAENIIHRITMESKKP